MIPSCSAMLNPEFDRVGVKISSDKSLLPLGTCMLTGARNGSRPKIEINSDSPHLCQLRIPLYFPAVLV
eukprot:4163241-Amphidinium_carterae.2